MRQPSILFILVDQMRADCTGFAGHPVAKTPALDALAARGTWYSNAFSPSPLCVPARAQLLTGRWGHETANRWGNDSWRYRGESPFADNGVIIDPETATLPELLNLAGYHTAAIGKCHYYPRRNPYGFAHRENGQATGRYLSEDDEYLAFLRHRGYESLHMDSFGVPPGGYNARRPDDPRTTRIVPHVTDLPAELQFTRWCTDRAIEFLEHRRAARPFFLQVGYHAPHDPYCVSRPYDRLYDPADMRPAIGGDEPTRNLPSFRHSGDGYSKNAVFGDLSETEQRMNWAYYLANITFIDEQVDRLLDTLDDLGLADDTSVIFTSDHGDHMGDHGLYGKSTFWDESIRVPLVVAPAARAAAGATAPAAENEPAAGNEPAAPIPAAAPATGRAKAASRSDELVTLMDIFPTILAMAGVQGPPDLRDAEALPEAGRCAAAPEGRGSASDAPEGPSRLVYGELGEGSSLRYMVRSQRWKYVVHPHHGAEELYDLATDPNELSNLAHSPGGHSGVPATGTLPSDSSDPTLGELRQALAAWVDRGRSRKHPLVPSMWSGKALGVRG